MPAAPIWLAKEQVYDQHSLATITYAGDFTADPPNATSPLSAVGATLIRLSDGASMPAMIPIPAAISGTNAQQVLQTVTGLQPGAYGPASYLLRFTATKGGNALVDALILVCAN